MRPSNPARNGDALISIVVPVFNEEAAIEAFLKEVSQHLAQDHSRFEILFVNDGSRDHTLEKLLIASRTDPRIRIIDLSRNFGKEAAMTAGLDYARGDAVIVMDVDLQEPPELITQMVDLWRCGFDVVNARRISRASDTAMKRLTSNGFYKWFNRMSALEIPEDVGDFRLMDRKVVEALQQLPERVRFMKGLFAWVGYRTATVDFERSVRQSGTTKFNYWRLWNFALDGFTSFSTVPLRIWSYFGGAVAILAFIYAAVIVARTLLFGTDIPGYASLLTVTLFLGGVQLVGLGVLGEYLGRVYVEVKQRPVYIAAAVYNNHTGSGPGE